MELEKNSPTVSKDIFLIDIESVLKKRGLKLPGFFLKFLKKLIHQDDMNDILTKYNDFEGIEFIDKALYDTFKIKPVVEGLENIQNTNNQRFIFCANHPLGGLDGLFFISTIGKILGQTKAIINDLLLNIKPLRPLFVGVNLYGGKTRETIKILDEVFASDCQLLFFPAGLVSRKRNGIIKDLEWKGTFIKQAVKHKRDIVPVYIDGKLSNFFYNFAKIRESLGIKFNYELILLPKEMFKQKNKTLTLRIGKPLSYSILNNTRSADEWATLLKDHVYNIGKNGVNEAFKV